MRLFCILILFWLTISFSFSKDQKQNTAPYSNYLKGLISAQKGDFDSALRELEKAKAKDPGSIHIRLKIATVLIHLDKVDPAIEVLKEAKKIDPGNLDASLALIFVYSYAGRSEEVEAEYELFLKQAHELKPKDISISEYLAQFYYYKKNPNAAIAIYEKIIELKPDYTEAFFWLGYLYEEAGNSQKAITTWNEGLKLDPSFAPILNSLGYIYAEQGTNLDVAEDMLKRALEKEPENGAYLDSLGWVYFKKNQFKKAESYLLDAISYVKDPDIYEHLGDLYVELGDNEKGVSYYKEGLAQFPEAKNLELKIKKYEKEDKGSKK